MGTTGRAVILGVAVLWGAAALAQAQAQQPEGGPGAPADPELKPTEFHHQIGGYFHVLSVRTDQEALGGFWRSDNVARPVPPDLPRREGELHLVALADKDVPFDGDHQGLRLLLVNATERTQVFEACDSRLFIVQEAQDPQGEWRPIEGLPRSRCGNSYHRVFLDPGQCWQVAAPRYSGEQSTRLRFRLDREGGEPIYSNEFSGGVNPEQFGESTKSDPSDETDPGEEDSGEE